MRICVLSDEEKKDFDVSPYLKEFDYEFITMRKPVMETLKALKDRNEFDLYLNVCEGYELDDEDENGPVEALPGAELDPTDFEKQGGIIYDLYATQYRRRFKWLRRTQGSGGNFKRGRAGAGCQA